MKNYPKKITLSPETFTSENPLIHFPVKIPCPPPHKKKKMSAEHCGW